MAGTRRPARGARSVGPLPPPGWEVLAWEDFADFPIGPFPYDYSPAAEYHDVQPEGYRGRWREAVVLHPWRGAASWNVVDAVDALAGDDTDGESVESLPVVAGVAMEQSCVRQEREA